MNIVVVASLTLPATANYLIVALRENGHELLVCSDLPSPLANVNRRGVVDVDQLCRGFKFSPELFLFIEGGSMQLFPAGLEMLPCITAWYGIDTHMDFAKHLRISRLFDVSFIAQKEYVARLHQEGLPQVHWLPLAFAPELLPLPLPQKCVDIAHVGSMHVPANPQRHALLNCLRRVFPSHFFNSASPMEMQRIYAQSRIVFNKSVHNDVNMRFFEAAGAGAVIVTDPIVENGLEELFEEGTHYLVYQDEESLLRMVRTLLSDPDRCMDMGAAARHRVLDRHTYAHRVKEMLALHAGAQKRANPTPEDYFAVYLKLGLLGAALHSVGKSIQTSDGGKYRQFLGGIIAGLLFVLSGVLSWIERLRAR
ncbi:MAG: hypothetical protein EBQ82_00800 [Betaproteobacteria bacterium]|nr:hypothetical protein [Betaproteobacteria bacterium]NBY03951.1 hypothetical protein [Betaproteobacteria bacterium]